MVIINSKESLQKNYSFQRIKKGLPGISSTVLSDRLLELEREGLISKKTFSEIPPKVEYPMTPQARDLETIMNELGKWATAGSHHNYKRLNSNNNTNIRTYPHNYCKAASIPAMFMLISTVP